MARIASVGCCGLVAALVLGSTSCNRSQSQGPDPAAVNMAPTGQAGQLAENQPAEPVQEVASQQPEYSQSGGEDQLSEAPQPPPPLPEYNQPPCPGENYLWTPGYWAYSPAGYYWVPGAWVMAPWVGALWTPPWWGFSGGVYLWHAGYWGPHIGFYGGINYGFGYTGIGFLGGYWGNGVFNYNRDALNVDIRVVHNVYNRPVVNYTPFNRISFNGPRGGINVQPNGSEERAFRERRMGALAAQTQLRHEAAANRAQFAAENRGRPGTVAAARPLANQNERPAMKAPARGVEPTGARAEARAPSSRPQPNERPSTRPGARSPGAMEAPARGVEPTGARAEARAPSSRPQPNERPLTRPGARSAGAMKAPARGVEPTGARAEARAPSSRPQPNERPSTRPGARSAGAMESRRIPQSRPESRPAPQLRRQAGRRPARQTPKARPAPAEKDHGKRG